MKTLLCRLFGHRWRQTGAFRWRHSSSAYSWCERELRCRCGAEDWRRL